MALWHKVALTLGILILAPAAAIIAMACFLLSGDLCANTITGEMPSPDGKMKVVVFERDCGATTASSTHVSVIPASENLANKGGNLFIADSNHDKAPSTATGGPEVRPRWLSSSRLEVHHHALARTFKSSPSENGVSTSYRFFQ